jgi:hypothetical protein
MRRIPLLPFLVLSAALAWVPPAAADLSSDLLENTSALPLGGNNPPPETLPTAATSSSSAPSSAGAGGGGGLQIKCHGCIPPASVQQLLRDQALKLGQQGRGGADAAGTQPPRYADEEPTIPPLLVPSVGPGVFLAGFAGAILVLARRRR